ncbi:hypothetical protein [Enterococcus sp. C50]|uniref:mannitol dehydrogenase family protein n=1 Tax=Enterococcus sp. C50 TaxID=3231311 RepID=UPI0034A07642
MIDLKDWQKSLTELKQAGITIPNYDVASVKEKGKEVPVWLHFGGGNLYRGFHAEIAQRLADKKELAAGIVVCETLDKEIIEKAYKPFHSDVVEVVMHDDGMLDKKLLAATADAFFCHPSEKESFAQVVHYLIIEDHFPNGRPALEKAGVVLTSQEIVDKADVMKVTTCLNPLHTAMAITGCLLGYQSIAAEMEDEEIVGLIKAIGYQEGLPVVEDPQIIDPKQFIDEVIKKRLPNPNIPDTPQRIASDTSQKVAIRFGETIKKYTEKSAAQSLVFIPVAIAAWLRYLLAVDDEGNEFVPSPDPLLAELQEQLASLHLGEQSPEVIHQSVASILANETIFGSNLYEVGLGEKIEQIVTEMLVGPGAVRQTIRTYLTNFGGK